jgi:PTH2 family peptidyl-tRNA hydrolase
MNNNANIKQYIILRKDAKTITGEPVSANKLAVMTSHASMAFISTMIKENISQNEDGSYNSVLNIDGDVFENWFNDAFTKVLLSAKNLNDLNKAVIKAKELGLVEGKDFFCIRDNCYTELIPDENEKTCFIAIGFAPMDVEKIKPLTKKYQLYK